MGRHSKPKSAVIKEKIVQGTQDGKNQGVIAGELKVSREHVNRTLAELRDRFKDRSPEAFSAYVHRQVELLTQAIEEVWEGKLPPEAANSIRGLMDSIARLTGSNAPTRSESLNVNVDANVSSLYAKFVRIVGRKLRKPESWAALWNYLEALPVDPVEEPAFMHQRTLPEVTGGPKEPEPVKE